MGRFREIKPRVTTRREVSRLRPIALPDEVTVSDARAERNRLYKSDRWVKLRARYLSRECRRCFFCHEVTTAAVLEHLVGHGEDAERVAAALGIPPINPDWRERFWDGPFVGACQAHARQRSGFEAAGRLLKWTNEWLDDLLI